MVKNAEVNKVVKDLSVDDILELIKNPTEKGKNQGKCILIRKMESLPDSVREAITLAMDNPDVTNRDILAFFTNHTDVKVTHTNVQDHRAKAGCLVCLYGGSR